MPQRPVLYRTTDIQLLFLTVKLTLGKQMCRVDLIFYSCQGLVFVISYTSWSMKHGVTVSLNSKNHIPVQSEPHCPSADFYPSTFWKMISLDLNSNGHQFMSRTSSVKAAVVLLAPSLRDFSPGL